MSHESLPPDLEAVQAALGALRPFAGHIDRDGLMFRAGRRAARRQTVACSAASALVAAVLVGLAVGVGTPRQTVATRVYVRVEPPPRQELPQSIAPERAVARKDEEPSTPSYLALRQQVVAHGVEALPVPRWHMPTDPPLTLNSLLETAPRPQGAAGSL